MAPFSSSFSGTPVILMLILWMVSDRHVGFFFTFSFFFPFFFSDWVISKFLSSKSLILSFAYSFLLLMLFLAFFITFIEFFGSRICLVFHLWFYLFCSLPSYIVLLICWLVFIFFVIHWVSSKWLFWILYWVNHRTLCLWVQLLGK